MSMRGADLRFVLAEPPTRALVIGEAGAWHTALAEAGIVQVAGVDDQLADGGLVVANADAAEVAAGLGAPAVVLHGARRAASLRRAGFRVRRFLALPNVTAPELLLPLDDAAPAAYALRNWTVPPRRWKHARNGALAWLLARGVVPPSGGVVAVGQRSEGPPFLLAAAERLGVPADAGWFLTFGEGDDLTRGVFQLFPRGEPAPEWILKFSRVPGYTDPFDRDERALTAVAAAGRTAAARAPRLLGRFELQGLAASVESAGVGSRLNGLLASRATRRAKLRVIEAVAAWLVEVAGETAGREQLQEDERDRLRRELPDAVSVGVVGDLMGALPPLPAVLEHRDLGSWNILAAGEEFTVVDWESACRHGFPLWDLVYFLADALSYAEGAQELADRPEYVRRLFRGELRSSKILFRWLRTAAEALSIERSALGPLVTLCWIHHGLSYLRRDHFRTELGSSSQGLEMPFERIVRIWLSDPALGPSWAAAPRF